VRALSEKATVGRSDDDVAAVALEAPRVHGRARDGVAAAGFHGVSEELENLRHHSVEASSVRRFVI
jgi:hypothetical protein